MYTISYKVVEKKTENLNIKFITDKRQIRILSKSANC